MGSERGHWNYRVVRLSAVAPEDEVLRISEVYYDANGNPTGHCEATVMSETPEGLKWVIDRINEALAKPVLLESEIGQ